MTRRGLKFGSGVIHGRPVKLARPRFPDDPLRTAYTEGMGWRVMRGPETVASGFDTREEAQAHLEGLTKWGLVE